MSTNFQGLTKKESAEKRKIDRLAMMHKATRSQLMRGFDLVRKINNSKNNDNGATK